MTSSYRTQAHPFAYGSDLDEEESPTAAYFALGAHSTHSAMSEPLKMLLLDALPTSSSASSQSDRSEIATPHVDVFDMATVLPPMQFPIPMGIVSTHPVVCASKPLPARPRRLSSFSTTRSLVPNNMPPMPCHRFGETSTGHRKRCPSSASGRSSESLATAEHKSKAESVDLTRRPTVSATTTASTIHRRTKSHTLVKRHAHNNSTSLNNSDLVARRPRAFSSVNTTNDELTSMTGAAEMVLRRRTRSQFDIDVLESFMSRSSPPRKPMTIENHRRTTSLGGEHVESLLPPVPPPKDTPPPTFPRSASGRSLSRTLARADDPPKQIRVGKKSSSPPLRSPPPRPFPSAPPPPLPLLDLETETLLAIREAERWDWPVPPVVARRPPKLNLSTTTTTPSTHPPLSPRLASMDFSSPFDSFSWDTKSTHSADSTKLPSSTASSSSTVSAGIPITPDELHFDPFEHSPRSPKAQSPLLSPGIGSKQFYHKHIQHHRQTYTPARYRPPPDPRYGVPF